MAVRSRFRIPIAIKLVVITTILLLFSMARIAFKTSEQFVDEVGKKEEVDNLTQARVRAEEINALLGAVIEKTRVIASLLSREYDRPEDRAATLDLTFFQDKDLVTVEVWKIGPGGPELAERVVQESYLKQDHELTAEYINMVRTARPFPLAVVFAGEGRVEVRNSSVPEGVPLLTIGFPFSRDEASGRITHVAVADLKLDRIQRAFANDGEKTIYLLDQEGQVLAHPDDRLAIKAAKLNHIPIVQKARAAKIPGQGRFPNPEDEEIYVGGYAPTRFGATVVSQTPLRVILEPAREMRRMVFQIAGYALSAALFFIFVFSISLTNPIERLVDITREIARGNFNVQAMRIVRSHDEVGELAAAFDSMTDGLKERDKVKSMFSKFHGSSVAEDILKGGDASLRGTARDVTVFFSDIRDFTKFSEGHTPEEVVTMLNEYFEIMVGIINRSGGVVDKFIGDAIMAVWGAPTSSGRDAENAVRACVEMRKALASLNERRAARGKVPIKIGMGLHTGRAISGTIGSTERMEYTVIGDTVNMAARIEASTKAFGTDLLLSDVIAQIVKDQFLLEDAGRVEVKGKSEPLTLHKVRGFVAADGSPVIVRTPYSDYEAGHDDKVKVA